MSGRFGRLPKDNHGRRRKLTPKEVADEIVTHVEGNETEFVADLMDDENLDFRDAIAKLITWTWPDPPATVTCTRCGFSASLYRRPDEPDVLRAHYEICPARGK